jgi:hypothetical protein
MARMTPEVSKLLERALCRFQSRSKKLSQIL